MREPDSDEHISLSSLQRVLQCSGCSPALIKAIEEVSFLLVLEKLHLLTTPSPLTSPVKLFRAIKANGYVFKEVHCLTVGVYSDINKGAEAHAFTVL